MFEWERREGRRTKKEKQEERLFFFIWLLSKFLQCPGLGWSELRRWGGDPGLPRGCEDPSRCCLLGCALAESWNRDWRKDSTCCPLTQGTSVPGGVLATKAQHAVLTICFGGRRRSNEITMFLFVTRKSLILSISMRSSKSHWLCLLVSDLLMQRNERGTLLSVNCLTLETK